MWTEPSYAHSETGKMVRQQPSARSRAEVCGEGQVSDRKFQQGVHPSSTYHNFRPHWTCLLSTHQLIKLDGAQRRRGKGQGRQAKRAREPGQAKEEGQGEERREIKGAIYMQKFFIIQFSFEKGLQAACPPWTPRNAPEFQTAHVAPRAAPSSSIGSLFPWDPTASSS